MLYGNQMTRRCTCPGKLSSPLETSKKRSKTVKSSCKNCGGKFVVDGIEPMSKSVLGTVGQKVVASSITPEFNWKTVTKGKRSRKAVARCMNRSSELGSKSPKRVGDFSGSDSDKLGETGNGQCFSDKPLKKRRHFYRSPSPSSRPSYGAESISPSQIPTLSSHSEGLEHNGSSGSYTNGLRGQAGKDVDIEAVDVKASKLTNGVFYSPDFHGISLLAAAACINTADDVAFNVKAEAVESLVALNVKAEAVEVSSAPQRSDGSTSSLPQAQNACSESGKQLDKPKDESVGSAAAKPVTSKVDRLHWDLNAPMEAWEQPIDDDTADSSMFVSTDGTPTTLLDKDGLAVDKVSKDKENDAETVLPLNQIKKESYVSKSEENSSEGCRPQRFGSEENSLRTLNGSSRDELASLAPVDTKLPAPLLISNEFCDNFPEAESCQSSVVSGVCLDAKSDMLAVALDKDSCKNAIPPSQCYLSHHNVASRDDSGSVKCAALTDVPEDSQKITEFPVNVTSLGQEICFDSSNILGAENSGGISANSTQPLLKHPSVATSDISITGVSHDSCDVQEARLLADLTLGKGAGEDSSSKKILSKHEDPHTCKLVSDEENQKECHNLNVRQDIVEEAPKKLAEPEGGYDSPYEDGELRGSILYSWEENEWVDGEQECVDYESDGRGGEEFEAGDFHDPNVVEADSEGTEKRSYLPVHDDTGALRSPRRRDLEKNNFEKTDDASAEKLSNQGSGTTEELAGDVIGRNYGRVRRHQAAADHLYADEEKGSGREAVKSRMNRGKFQPRFEGAASFDTMEGDFVPNRRFRDGAPNFRGERDGVPDRFYKGYRPDFHSRERSGGDGECDYWESRNCYPSGYRGHGSTRPRMTGPNSRGKFDQKPHPLNYSCRAERDASPDRLVSRYGERDRNGQVTYWEPPPRLRYPSMQYDGPLEENGQSRSRNADKFGRFNKQSMDYPSNNMQRPLGWNRSLNGREFRGGSPQRFPGYNNGGGRVGGGPRRFSEGFNRGGFREEYHPSHDEDPSSWRGERRYFSQSSRGGHASGPNRRSRSKTRSPRLWGPSAQRERSRRHSRSPDFRPRGPFQKPSFAADYDDSYMSPPPPPRGRFTSPQRSFRGEANDGSFRQRRPSYNGFRQGQRFDSGEGLNLEEADDGSYLRNRRQPFNAFRQGGLPEEDGLKPEESSRPGGDCFNPEESSRLGGECKTENGNVDKEQDNRSEVVH